jgi:hypothetical protein
LHHSTVRADAIWLQIYVGGHPPAENLTLCDGNMVMDEWKPREIFPEDGDISAAVAASAMAP